MRRMLAVALAAMVLAIGPSAAAQAIGDDLATFLDASGAEQVGDSYRVGDLSLAPRAPGGVFAGLTLTGALDEQGGAVAAATLAIATGYGAGIEQPLARFLRERAPDLAGQGPVFIAVEAYRLELDVASSDLAEVRLSLELPRTPAAAFGAPVATLGSDDAPVTIRVFSDFQCPFCQRFATEVMPGLEQGPLAEGRARFAFHHFPLTSIHANAAPAAEAAECVALRFGQTAFWEYHDLLFGRLDAWQGLGDPYPYFVRLATDAPGLVEQVADELAVGTADAGDEASERLAACLDDGSSRDAVRAATERARSLGLNGTPSVFVGGYRLEEFGQPQAYARLLRLAIAQDGAAP